MNDSIQPQGNTQALPETQYLRDHADLVIMGRQYPADFLYSLQEDAAETLNKWFKKHGVPVEVRDLVDQLGILYTLTDKASEGTLNDFEASLLPETVSTLTELTAQLKHQ